MLDTFTDAV